MLKLTRTFVMVVLCCVCGQAKEWPTRLTPSPIEVRFIRTARGGSTPTGAESKSAVSIGRFMIYGAQCADAPSFFASLEDTRKLVQAAGFKDISVRGDQAVIARNPAGEVRVKLVELDPATRPDSMRGVGVIQVQGQSYYNLADLKGLFGGMAGFQYGITGGKPLIDFFAPPSP